MIPKPDNRNVREDLNRIDMDIVRRLAAVSANISLGRPLAGTLQAVADGVVEGLGFGAAAVNFVLDDGDIEISAVAGPVEVKQALAGKIVPRHAFEDLVAKSEAWGSLLFVPRGIEALGRDYEWVPDTAEPVGPDDWHQEDALIGPMYSSSGELIGFLSVDMPPDGRRPSTLLCELLQIFAVQSGIAIENARLLEDLRRERDRFAAGTAAFRFFFAAGAGPMATISLHPAKLGQILQANEALAKLLGYEADELSGRTCFSLLPPDESDLGVEFLAHWPPGKDLRADCRLVRGDGSTIWVRLRGAAVNYPSPNSPILLVQADDITEQRALEENLTEMAHIDPLTGLPNRRALTAYLQVAIAEARRGQAAGVVIYADLDDFKQVNDRYGHSVGDEVLKQAATRLASQFRACDLVARIGGDEFAIVATDMDVESAKVIMDRVRCAFNEPIPGHPDGGRVSVSLGAADLAVPGTCPAEDAVESVIHQADMAMYADKRSG